MEPTIPAKPYPVEGVVPALDHAAFLDALPDALLLVTPEAKITRAHGSTPQLLGLDSASLPGSSLFDHLHPDDLAAVRLPWRVHARRAGSRVSFRWRLLHRQGTWRDASVASHHVAGVDGRPGAILLSLRDVTEQLREERLEAGRQQRLEEELSQLRAAIGTMEEATAWAQQMAGRAMMESIARGGHLARMSHEIRTPLNGILGTLDLLVDLDLTQEQRDLVQTSLRAGEAMLDLVNEILDFARLEADTIQLESIPFDPREVIEEAVAVFAGRTEAKGLELGVDIHEDVPAQLRGDPARLRQMLMNLVGNALKFTAQGEVFVTLERMAPAEASVDAPAEAPAEAPANEPADPERPEPTGTASDGTTGDAPGGMTGAASGSPGRPRAGLLLSVRDTGIGIARSEQGRVFEAFRQAEASTTRRYGGTGLGLAITRRLAEAMGGSIDMISAPGKGSTFRLRLTLPIEAEAAPPPAVPPGLAVLLMVESAALRGALCRRLTAWGAEVRTADSGADGHGLLESRDPGRPAPSLVILDSRFEGRRWESWLASAPRASTGRPVPVMLLAGMSLRVPRERLDQLGVGRVLFRPVRGGQLHRALLEMATPFFGHDILAAGGKPAPATTRSGRALVVDDDPINRTVGCRLLQNLGLETEVAVDGTGAVERVRSEHFDLILMDRWMPGLDGADAARQIRVLEGDGRRTPILAVTGDLTDEAREECRQAGMDEILGKPLRARTLRAAVERWLPASRQAA